MADLYDVNKDRYVVTVGSTPGMPSRGIYTVNPSDVNDLTNAGNADPTPSYAKSLYIGGAGDVAVIFAADKSNGGAGTPRIFKAHPIGYLPAQVRRVMSTNTTATNILALAD